MSINYDSRHMARYVKIAVYKANSIHIQNTNHQITCKEFINYNSRHMAHSVKNSSVCSQ